MLLSIRKKQYKVEYGLIICAMRHLESEVSEEMAELAVYFRDRGVVGFDLAGDESGHPARHHIKAFQFIQQQNFYITICQQGP